MHIQALAAKTRRAKLVPWTYTSPNLGLFDCLIRVRACGICLSDLHMINDDWNMSSFPLVPGHEVIGEIVDRGSQVTHLDIGERIGVGWQRSSCLQCQDCLEQNENLCAQATGLIVGGHGGFADFMVADSRFCYPIPKAIVTERAAPLLCAGHTVYAAMRAAGMASGQNIGVLGLGGLGQLAVEFAAKLGNRVTIFSSTKDKIKAAEKLGAQEAILTNKGKPKTKPSHALDILISTVPEHVDWDAYLETLGSDGTLTLVGALPSKKPFSFSFDTLLAKRRRIMASPIGGRAAMMEMLNLADRYHIQPKIESFPMAEANRALRALQANRIRYRAVLVTNT